LEIPLEILIKLCYLSGYCHPLRHVSSGLVNFSLLAVYVSPFGLKTCFAL
jgi:hypothetical protein